MNSSPPLPAINTGADASALALTLRALRRAPETADRFPDDVLELQALLAPAQPGQRIQAVPGARPSPRSIRPGNNDSSVPNCSAITSGEWFGSMIPPEPTRIVLVPPAMCAITIDVAALAIPGML